MFRIVSKNYLFNPDQYLEKIKYEELDKWSYIQDIASHDAYFDSGEQVGFGFMYRFDEENNC